MKCPKCNTDNPDDSKFCKECASSLFPDTEHEVSFTKTMQTPSHGMQAGILFADRYKIIQELGRGGMGVVYKAEDTKLERTVALKLLPPHLIGDSDAKERFIREAQAAAKLDHPHICTVHEIAEIEDGQVYIAMACYEGQSLKDRIKEGPIPFEEALGIAAQIAQGLDKAHREGIIHRDIKPANIMATTDGVTKIVDFGLAKLSGQIRVTKTGTAMGTVAYMSPEQARGETVDQRSDIWSVGVVLYEILTGELPFTGEHEHSVMYAIMNTDPEPVTETHPDIPQDVDHIIQKALAKKPEDRYQHIQEFLGDLNAVLQGLAPEKAGARPPRSRAQKFRLIVIFPLLVLASVAALFMLFSKLLRPPDSTQIDSIAILPLTDYSADADQNYYTDSLTAEIIHKFGQISAFKRVTPHYSAMQYKGTKKIISEIARELNVESILTGSVTRSRGSLRMRLQLIDPETEAVIWQNEYDRDLEDIIILQDEIAQTIANAIDMNLTSDEKRRLSSSLHVGEEVYDLVMKGRHHLRTGALTEGQKCFQEAIDQDPSFAPAYVGLSRAYMQLSTIGFLPPHEGFPKSKEIALKALKLDEENAEVHVILAWINWWYDWDWDGVEREYQRALRLNPNSTDAHRLYGLYLGFCKGKYDEALSRIKYAVERDPFLLVGRLNLAETYFYAGQRDLAWKEVNDVLEKNPNILLGPFYKGYFYVKEKRFEDSVGPLERTLEINPRWQRGKAWLGYVYGKLGDRSKALQIYNELEQLSKQQYVSALWMALVSLGMNDYDRAFSWLDKSIEQRDRQLPIIEILPGIEDLKNEPRFIEILRRIGLDKIT